MSPELDRLQSTMIAFNDPFARPLHFATLELVVAFCFGITVFHAVSRYRRGDSLALFQWLVIAFYGIAMELIAFNAFQNYDHAIFTVQLYHGKLPLYITGIYVVLHYSGIKIVERMGLGRAPEALVAGLSIALLDVPFDILGVDAGWWIWSSTDRDLSARWLGVPVTSYYWYMLFGAILTALCRTAHARLGRRTLAARLAAAPGVALAVIVLGIAAFLPFHGLKALGVPDGAIVAAHAAVCLGIAVFARPSEPRSLARGLLFIPAALHAFFGTLLVVLWRDGRIDGVLSKLEVISAAALLSWTLAVVLPLSRLIPARRWSPAGGAGAPREPVR